MLREGKACGELTVEREGLYIRFTAAGSLPDDRLWCAWAVGEKGELRLGVLEPEKGRGRVSRRFSGREASVLGRCLRCEVRRAGETPRTWSPVGDPAVLFHSPELRRLLAGKRGVLVCREGETLLLACPWEKRQPFPLVPLFCFARLRCVGSRYFLVFAFEGERPAFYEQEKSGEN